VLQIAVIPMYYRGAFRDLARAPATLGVNKQIEWMCLKYYYHTCYEGKISPLTALK